MRILIACEFSGRVRRAFAAHGHDVWSCDLLPAEDGSARHIVGDVRDVLEFESWDMLIGFPECTRLTNAGSRWLTKPPPGRTLADLWAELDEGAALFSALWNAPVPRIALENPAMHKHAKARIVNYRPPAQIVHPYWFGHKAFKGTHLYLKRLQPLEATGAYTPPPRGSLRRKAWHVTMHHKPGADRWKERSRTFEGLAEAMADQWGTEAGWARSRILNNSEFEWKRRLRNYEIDSAA